MWITIYFPCKQWRFISGSFNTTADIRLKQWTDLQLPHKCVEIAWETLEEEFRSLIKNAEKAKDHDGIFDALKKSVVDEAMSRHSWEDKVSFVY